MKIINNKADIIRPCMHVGPSHSSQLFQRGMQIFSGGGRKEWSTKVRIILTEFHGEGHKAWGEISIKSSKTISYCGKHIFWLAVLLGKYCTRGQHSEELWQRSWKPPDAAGAEGSVFKPEVMVFHYTDHPEPETTYLFCFSCCKFTFKWVCLRAFFNWTGLRAVYRSFQEMKRANEWVTQILDKERCIE